LTRKEWLNFKRLSGNNFGFRKEVLKGRGKLLLEARERIQQNDLAGFTHYNE
jgi:hypothetical protein